MKFIEQLQKYLRLIYLKIKSYIAPPVAYLLERLQDPSSFMRIMLTFTIVYNVSNILWITIPILYTNLQEPARKSVV